MLAQTLGPALAEDVVVVVAGRRFRLAMADIGFAFRADRTAQRAFEAGQQAPPAADGTLPPASATPAVTFERTSVWRFAKATGEAVRVKRRDARVRITLTRMIKRKGRKAAGSCCARWSSRSRRRSPTRSPRARSSPAGTRSSPRSAPRTWREVPDGDHDRSRPLPPAAVQEAPVRQGLRGRGRHARVPDADRPVRDPVQAGQPDLDRAELALGGEMAGQQVAGGAWNNPLKARWMGVNGSVGIHGTGMPWSIGTRASHGCIRMTVPDVIDLFRRVSVGTPVLIR